MCQVGFYLKPNGKNGYRHFAAGYRIAQGRRKGEGRSPLWKIQEVVNPIVYEFGAKNRRIDWLYRTYAADNVVSVSDFVAKINEIYYRHSAEFYSERYVRDIEVVFSDLIRSLGLSSCNGLTIANIGGGAGFEYEQFLNNGIAFSKYIFIEPHSDMLNRFIDKQGAGNGELIVHQGNFEDYAPVLKKIGNKLIVMNSCLHHLVDLSGFLDSVKSCMIPGDFFAIGHEPQNRYFKSGLFFVNYAIRSLVTDFALRKAKLIRSRSDRMSNARWEKINNELRESLVAKCAIPAICLRRIIDYGVNTKGDWREIRVPAESDEGFWTANDIIEYMDSNRFRVVFFATYRHFGDSSGNLVIEFLNRMAYKIRLRGGSVFSLVLQMK